MHQGPLSIPGWTPPEPRIARLEGFAVRSSHDPLRSAVPLGHRSSVASDRDARSGRSPDTYRVFISRRRSTRRSRPLKPDDYRVFIRQATGGGRWPAGDNVGAPRGAISRQRTTAVAYCRLGDRTALQDTLVATARLIVVHHPRKFPVSDEGRTNSALANAVDRSAPSISAQTGQPAGVGGPSTGRGSRHALERGVPGSRSTGHDQRIGRPRPPGFDQRGLRGRYASITSPIPWPAFRNAHRAARTARASRSSHADSRPA